MASAFGLFVFLAALMLMNMLIAILCEVVTSVAECEKESLLIQFVTSNFEDLWMKLDKSGNGKLAKDEFLLMIQDQDAWSALQDIDVDPMSLYKLADLVYEADENGQERQLSLSELMEVVLSFRDTNTATVKDMNDLRKWMDTQLQKQMKDMKNLLKHFDAATDRSSFV